MLELLQNHVINEMLLQSDVTYQWRQKDLRVHSAYSPNFLAILHDSKFYQVLSGENNNSTVAPDKTSAIFYIWNGALSS